MPSDSREACPRELGNRCDSLYPGRLGGKGGRASQGGGPVPPFARDPREASTRQCERGLEPQPPWGDRKSTRLNSSHVRISYAVFCLKKKKKKKNRSMHKKKKKQKKHKS